MATSLPPVRGSSYTTYISLVSQADTDIFQKSVTLAAGDVKVSKDGGSENNIAALPTEIGTSGVLAVALTGTEMTADTVTVRFCDAAGDEWQDALIVIHTTAQTLDTIDTNVDSILADTGTDGVVVASLTVAGAAAVQAEAEDALEAYDLDHLIQVTAGVEEPTDGSYLDQVMHKSSGQTFDASTDSLQAIRDALTGSTVSITSSVASGVVTIRRGDSLSASITGLGDISGRSLLWFTVKDNLADADASAIIQIEETAGLVYLNGAAGTAAKGDITVDDASAGDITITLDETQTDDLVPAYGLYYDIQMSDGTDVTTLGEGPCHIVGDVTRAIA